MPDLRSALFGAGFASERQFREAEAAERLDAEAAAAKLGKSSRERARRMELLRSDSTPDLFRREARKLLLQEPSLLQEIISIAHQRGMPSKHKQGGGRLIANLLQLREALSKSGLSDAEKVQIVDKTFSNK